MTDQNNNMKIEEARRVLAQFDAEARAQAEAREREIAAEHARQTARRRRWAETYEPTADLNAAHAARHAARAAFLDALAAEPWVKALIEWQQAQNGPAAAVARASHARVALGQSVNTDDRGPNPLVEVINNVPSMPNILRALEALLADAAPYAPMAAVDAWVAAPDDSAGEMPV